MFDVHHGQRVTGVITNDGTRRLHHGTVLQPTNSDGEIVSTVIVWDVGTGGEMPALIPPVGCRPAVCPTPDLRKAA